MRSGWSLYHYEQQWYRHELADAQLSDSRLTFDINVEDGDVVTVTAISTDGMTYKGDYRYREGSYSNGEVCLERYKGPAGDVLVGEWREAGGPTGDWIIKLN
ncbi:MAG: hypothetical protein HY581_06115 [Nitrospirae bacterium]|nr:hypothetical protein [Nitrospirota bacterium]